ncbi:MAG: DedA family protein [candidate division NC10 bacterium]|nr:DedA family protein [candidate division NC10 bacterium]MDE2322733.1 DedA family protein [candidate division NC10 bacterium]
MFGLSPHELRALMAPYVAHWGYLLIGVIVVLGNVGVPVPEETALLVGGYFAAKGKLSLWGLIPTAIASATGGDSLGYWLGSRAGRRLLIQYGAALGVTQQRLARTEKLFGRYGPRTVFLARFVGGLRFMAGPMAGALGMPFPRFFRYNLAGAVVYCSTIVCLAYFSAHFFDRVVHLIAMANWILAILVLLATVGFVGWWLWRVRLQYSKG